jgi:hypothetical protein
MKQDIGVPHVLAYMRDPSYPSFPPPLTASSIVLEIRWYNKHVSRSRIVPLIRGIAIVEKEVFQVFVTLGVMRGYEITLTIHRFGTNAEMEIGIDLSQSEDISRYIMNKTGIYLSLNLRVFHHYRDN